MSYRAKAKTKAKGKGKAENSGYKVPAPSKVQPLNTVVVGELLNALQTSNDICVLKGREDETQEIRNFIFQNENNLRGRFLYVSGQPGTGKTATLRAVINERLEEDLTSENGENVIVGEINAVQLSRPERFYQWMYETLRLGAKGKNNKTPIIPRWERCQTALNKHFERRGKKPALIMIIDEVDYLLTGKRRNTANTRAADESDQAILMAILNWCQIPHSNLIVVTISNTVGLLERLIPKARSRVGVNCDLVFKPYSAAQIQAVVNSRLSEDLHQYVSPGVIELASKTAANVGGDVRSAFALLRTAIRRAHRTPMYGDDEAIPPKLTPSHVKQADREQISGFAYQFQQERLVDKAMLLAAFNLIVKDQSGEGVNIHETIEEFLRFMRSGYFGNELKPTHFDFQRDALVWSLGYLQSVGYIVLEADWVKAKYMDERQEPGPEAIGMTTRVCVETKMLYSIVNAMKQDDDIKDALNQCALTDYIEYGV